MNRSPNRLPMFESRTGSVGRLSVLGIGSDLRADDAAGVMVVRSLTRRLAPSLREKVQLVEGGTAPENVTGAIAAFAPTHLIIIDAAELGQEPGSTRFLLPGDIAAASFSTHTLPLTFIINYLRKRHECMVWLIGIQPGELTAFKPVTHAVKKAVQSLSRELIKAIPRLLQ